MKLYEVYRTLTEYKSEITLQKLGDKLQKHAGTFDQIDKDMSADDILTVLEVMDPTPNKKYMMWIIKQYLNKQFRLEDASRVKTLLATYTKAKPRLSADQKDINRFSFHQLDDLVDSWSDQVDTESTLDLDNVKVLYNGPYGFLGIPETEQAACNLGSGTKWCTSSNSDNMFDHYNENGPLYVWIEKPGNKKYQFHFESMQFMDAQDRMLLPTTLSDWRNNHPVLSKFFKKKESELLENGITPTTAVKYAASVIAGPWPEAEDIILNGPVPVMYSYIRHVLKERWPKAEPHIIKHTNLAIAYAISVIKGRWKEAEPHIMKDPSYAVEYARQVIDGRWPEAEPRILKDYDAVIEYLHTIVRSRWPEAEPLLAKKASMNQIEDYVIRYNKDNERIPVLEPRLIAGGSTTTLIRYAFEVLKKRWIEAEPIIQNNEVGWNYYTSEFPDAATAG